MSAVLVDVTDVTNGDSGLPRDFPSSLSMREDLLASERVPMLPDNASDALFIAASIHRFVPAGSDVATPIARLAVKLALVLRKMIPQADMNASDCIALSIEAGDDVIGKDGKFTSNFDAAGRPRIGTGDMGPLVQELLGQMKMDKEILRKVAVHCVLIATATLYKANHHFLTEESARSRKLMQAAGVDTFLRSQGAKLEREKDLSILLRLLPHPVALRKKWDIMINHGVDRAYTVRSTGFGSGNAKASVAVAVAKASRSDPAINLVLAHLPEAAQAALRELVNIHAKTHDRTVSVRYCTNSAAFGAGEFRDLAYLVEAIDPVLIKGICAYQGGTIAEQRTFGEDVCPPAQVASITKQMQALASALAGKGKGGPASLISSIAKKVGTLEDQESDVDLHKNFWASVEDAAQDDDNDSQDGPAGGDDAPGEPPAAEREQDEA